MADLSPVYPNEPFRLLDADVTNVLLAMAREWQSRNRGGGGGYLPSVPQGDPVSVVIQNRTGSDLDQYAIVGISDALVPYATDSTEFKRRPQFRATAPSATAPFAVLQHPLKNWVSDSTPNTIGRAVISGCTVCKLNIGDSSHTYAAPTTSTTELTTGTSGPARILAKESGTGAGKWGIVFLSNADASPPAIEYETFVLTSAVNFNGNNTANIVQEITGFTKASGGTTTYLEFPSAGVWRVDAVITGTVYSPPSSGNVSVPALLMGRMASYSSTMLTPDNSVGGASGVITDSYGQSYSGDYTGYGTLTLSAYFDIATANTKAITLESAIIPLVTFPAGNLYASILTSNTYISGLTQVSMFKVSE